MRPCVKTKDQLLDSIIYYYILLFPHFPDLYIVLQLIHFFLKLHVSLLFNLGIKIYQRWSMVMMIMPYEEGMRQTKQRI
jgi:hypothetical protein